MSSGSPAKPRDPGRARDIKLWLALILGSYLALGAVYLSATPIFEASDELVHYPYVKSLADGRGLPPPVADRALNPAQQEATQPPLYYALGALATFWLDTGPLGTPYSVNPHARIGEPSATDNRNMVVPADSTQPPGANVALAVRIVRWISLLMGAGTVVLTFLIARTVVPSRPDLALGAAALNAVIPGFLFIAASVNNDNLVTLLSSLAVWLLLRIASGSNLTPAIGATSPLRGEGVGGVVVVPPVRALALLGLVVGGAALAKLGGLLLVPLVAAGLAIRIAGTPWTIGPPTDRRSEGACPLREAHGEGTSPSPTRVYAVSTVAWRRLVRAYAIVFGAAFAVAGWWYVRNWLLYGDPTLLTQHVAITGGRPTPVTVLDVLFREGEGLRWSFWGVFGGFNVAADPLIYRLYDGLTLVALAGLVVLAVNRLRPHPRLRHPLSTMWRGGWGVKWALLALWVALLFVGLLRWSLLTMASQGRFLYPAMAAICLGLVTGWQAWLGGRTPGIALAGLIVPMAALALVIPLAYIAPAYRVPPLQPAGALAAEIGPATLDLSFEHKLMLVSTKLSPQRLVGGDDLAIDLYWRVLAPMDRDYSVYVQLYDGAGRVVARRDTYPGGGGYATSRLPIGAELHDRYMLQVDPSARAGDGHLDVGLYEYPAQARLQPYDGLGRPIPSPNVREVRFFALEPPVAPPANALRRDFGDFAELTGWTLTSSSVARGEALVGSVLWRATSRPDRDYTIFVHLAREGASPIAQSDGQPQGGAYPTGVWRAGDEVEHQFAIAIPPGAPAGDYSLLVGMYDGATGATVPVRRTGLGGVLDNLRGLIGRPGAEETAVVLGTVRLR